MYKYREYIFHFLGKLFERKHIRPEEKPKETEILILSIYIQPQPNSVNAEIFNPIDWKICKEIFDLWC
jgi:hypothetical protein